MFRRFRRITLITKALSTAVGIFFIYSTIFYLITSSPLSNFSFGYMIVFFAVIVSLVLSSILIAELPSVYRIRFRKPTLKEGGTPVYGFFTLFAIGLGTTIGSPLFILIPENIYEYFIVSISSLVLAVIMSYLLAYLYDRMHIYSHDHNLNALGGPSFIRTAYGRQSLRYFISRFSMWIANTSLAAFSVIYFVEFTFNVISPLLAVMGVSQILRNGVIAGAILFMIIWFVINAFYGKRYMRGIGIAQIIFLTIMVSIIFFDALDLGFGHSWNMSGLLVFHAGAPELILINTGYLFILFFGFQEIQVMVRDSKDESRIPIISFITGKAYPKRRYMPYSMYATIAGAGFIQVLYALAVFSVHAQYSAVETAVIPAIYIASVFQNNLWALAMAVSFLLATVTTFVPAFMAASRHLRSLAEDGIFPQSFSTLSWVFTFVLIIFMSLGGTAFLVNITDFMVLISLSLIALAAIPLRDNRSRFDHVAAISIITFLMFMIGAVSIYFNDKSVVILGIMAILSAYLLYDIMKLSMMGMELFGLALGIMSLLSLLVFKAVASPTVRIIGNIAIRSPYNLIYIELSLIIMSIMLILNVLLRLRTQSRNITFT
ncbi:APC family permease [Thermoplasma sp. Kam2015]|uniref:APC family permease n=1 Tax=Thermoplasma sp. Kam2015 TaxID=2094122 RepID=UPI000D9E695F|nr:APC family permease [Thermoplasma sp. Kam2015]PYB68773.1 APC family permease [Thermoplasma sp. Kam2015]